MFGSMAGSMRAADLIIECMAKEFSPGEMAEFTLETTRTGRKTDLGPFLIRINGQNT